MSELDAGFYGLLGCVDNVDAHQLLGKAKGQGFPQKLAAELEAFNEKRISGIHHYLLGQADYEEIGGAYRDADGLFERISTAMDLPPLFG